MTELSPLFVGRLEVGVSCDTQTSDQLIDGQQSRFSTTINSFIRCHDGIRKEGRTEMDVVVVVAVLVKI